MTVSNSDILQRLDAGNARFVAMEKLIKTVAKEQRSVKNDVAGIKSDVAGARAEIGVLQEAVAKTNGLVETWTTVRSLAKFLKWGAGVIAAIAAIWLSLKTGAAHVFR